LNVNIPLSGGAKGKQARPRGAMGHGKVVATLSERDDDRKPFSARLETACIPPQASIGPSQCNRVLVAALISVAASVFAIIVTLVVLFHYAETHHMLASL
jgi:hypothetical protein